MSTKVVKRKGTTFFQPEFRETILKAVKVCHDISQKARFLIKFYYLQQKSLDVDKVIKVDEDLIKIAYDVVQSSPDKKLQVRNATPRKSKIVVKPNNEGKDQNKKPKNDDKPQKQKTSKDWKIETFDRMKEYFIELFGNQGFVHGHGLSLSLILNYSMKQLQTDFINNIVFHYPKYIKKLLKWEWNLDGRNASRKLAIIINNPNELSDLETLWCQQLCPSVLKERHGLLENFIEKDPWTFLQEMFVMTKCLEAYNHQTNDQVRLLNPFPMSTSFVPTHIHLDTSGLVQLLMTSEALEVFKNNYRNCYDIELNCKNKADILGSFEKLTGISDPDGTKGAEHNTRLWEFFCNFDIKKYKNILKERWNKNETYVFDNSIKTDGISISFTRCLEEDKRKKLFSTRKGFHTKAIKEFKTLENLTPQEAHHILETCNIVGVDPGKSNLVQASNGQETFKFTSRQRRLEKKEGHMKKKLANHEGKISKDYKESLSHTNSRSLGLEKFKSYIKAKYNAHNLHDVLDVYRKSVFRSQKFTKYCLSKSSDDKFLHRMKKWSEDCSQPCCKHKWILEKKSNDEVLEHIYENFTTKKRKTLVIYGNGGKNGNKLKGTSSCRNVGIERRVFKRFDCYEGDERDTSQTCPCCREKQLEKASFKDRKRQGTIHQLLHCKNVNCSSRWWSRDVLGAFNILYKGIVTLLKMRAGMNTS